MKELDKYIDRVKYNYDPEWQSIEIKGELKPRDYFNYAIKDLENEQDSRSLINALLNAKKALHYQIDLLIDAYGFNSHKNRNSFPVKLDYCKRCGIVSPRILSKLNITSDELKEAMREHGVEYFKDVKLAMLEIDGNISIISGENNLRQTHYKRRRIHKNLAGIN